MLPGTAELPCPVPTSDGLLLGRALAPNQLWLISSPRVRGLELLVGRVCGGARVVKPRVPGGLACRLASGKLWQRVLPLSGPNESPRVPAAGMLVLAAARALVQGVFETSMMVGVILENSREATEECKDMGMRLTNLAQVMRELELHWTRTGEVRARRVHLYFYYIKGMDPLARGSRAYGACFWFSSPHTAAPTSSLRGRRDRCASRSACCGI